MSRIIFDIETLGEDFSQMDETTQNVITRWIRKESASEEEYKVALEELKEGLGFSPLTGQIITIGILDTETAEGKVYFQAPDSEIPSFSQDGFSFEAMSEKEMLVKFWEAATRCDEFISFNGRSFDAPFIIVRSAVYGIRPTRDLMSNRYLSGQKYGVRHIDLLDQLTFYGAVRKKGNLHLWTRVFGIKSPKTEGLSGEMIGTYFKARKYKEIASYNAGDLRATYELWRRWDKFIKS